MSKTKIWCCPKNNFVSKQKVWLCTKSNMVSTKTSWRCAKNISCQQKKVMLHKKCVSCRQKQDNAASKNILVSKKLLSFSRTARHYFVQRNPPACPPGSCFFCTNNATSKSIILSCIIILYEKLKNYSIQSFK